MSGFSSGLNSTSFVTQGGSPPPPVRVHLTNTYGSGFCEWITVPAGTTVESLFAERTNNAPASSFTIFLNGQGKPSSSTVLLDGDRVAFTPQKITVA